MRATVAEQHVIIQLIFFHGWPLVDPLCGRAFDEKNDNAVVIYREYIPSESVVIWFPPNQCVLQTPKPRVSMRKRHSGKDRKGTHDTPLIGQVVPPSRVWPDVGHLCKE
jgi:hypothetical protein